jgi:hypothetical protein
VPQIIDECRSQNIALIISHQRLDQIHSANVLSALGNCALRYANSDEENRVLAPKPRTTEGFLNNLKVGEFAAYVRDMTSNAVALRVNRIDTKTLPRLTHTPAPVIEPVLSEPIPTVTVSPSKPSWQV